MEELASVRPRRSWLSSQRAVCGLASAPRPRSCCLGNAEIPLIRRMEASSTVCSANDAAGAGVRTWRALARTARRGDPRTIPITISGMKVSQHAELRAAPGARCGAPQPLVVPNFVPPNSTVVPPPRRQPPTRRLLRHVRSPEGLSRSRGSSPSRCSRTVRSGSGSGPLTLSAGRHELSVVNRTRRPDECRCAGQPENDCRYRPTAERRPLDERNALG